MYVCIHTRTYIYRKVRAHETITANKPTHMQGMADFAIQTNEFFFSFFWTIAPQIPTVASAAFFE